MVELKRIVSGKRGKKTGYYAHSTLWRTVCLDWKSICWYSYCRNWRNLGFPIECGEGDHFSDSTFVACKWGVWGKKHTWPYWLMTRPVEQRGLRQVGTWLPQAEEESLENKRGTQTQEQWHRNFSNLALKENYAKPSILLWTRDGGGVLPAERAHYKYTVMDKTVAEVLTVKNLHKKPY